MNQMPTTRGFAPSRRSLLNMRAMVVPPPLVFV
jgi:hypothetical protein